ncbi:MAG: 4Fe-4S binding protein [Candidatus Micrarchaeaceae archaeon]
MLDPLSKTIKNALEKRFTTEYPEKREKLPDSYRGMLRLDMHTCISCAACERICPNKTITMVDTETERGTKKMPLVNHERCLLCGLCEEVCPPHCLTLTKEYDNLVVYDRRELIKRPEELR